jgi:rhamnose transport system ATP-binding protein
LFLERRRERAIAEAQAARLQVRATSVDQLASALSGGNQQKVVLAKWLAAEPTVLILDEPTRGVDIGAKAEVHRIMSQLAAEGMALILISSELPEMLGMADRVVVMHEGTVTAEFDRRQADPEKVMFAATGQARADG